jgi:hypothetical protein
MLLSINSRFSKTKLTTQEENRPFAAAAAVVGVVVDVLANVVCESLLAKVRLTDGCCGFVVSLPILLDRDVNAHDVQDVSLAVPATLLELTSFSMWRK